MYVDQLMFKKEADKLFNTMRRGKAEKLHNWVRFETSNEERQFTLVCYGYRNSAIEDRDAIINNILDMSRVKDKKGILIIAVNVDKQHYPYSVLASTLSPELFENRYLQRK